MDLLYQEIITLPLKHICKNNFRTHCEKLFCSLMELIEFEIHYSPQGLEYPGCCCSWHAMLCSALPPVHDDTAESPEDELIDLLSCHRSDP